MITVKPLHVGPTGNHGAADRNPRPTLDTFVGSDDAPYRNQLWYALTQRRQSASSLVRGLPLAGLSIPERASKAYITTMEVRGRLADQSPLRVLHWQPGLPVDITPMSGLLLIKPSGNGSDAIARQGHVRLPARIRHACHLDSGDRLLMAAYPDLDLLLIYPMATLNTMILNHATAMRAAV